MPTKRSCYISGFSLVELLVVISIIALLGAIGLTVYQSVEVRSRDNQRMADLKQVQAALEQYHNDVGYYPTVLNFDSGGKISNNSNTYLNILPRDPLYSSGSTQKDYLYIPRPNPQYLDNPSLTDCKTNSKCVGYCIYAELENTPASSTTDSTCLTSSFTTGNSGYNYAVQNGTNY